MDSLLQRLEERETAARDQVERLRAQITSLSAQLAAEEDALSRLAITRQTILTVLGDDATPDTGVATPDTGVATPDTGVATPDTGVATPPVAAHDAMPEASQRVLDVFAAAGQPLRAKQVCQAVGAGTDARQVERMRTRLKRLVGRGVLAEPQPGLFVIPGTAGAAEPATTAAQREEDQ